MMPIRFVLTGFLLLVTLGGRAAAEPSESAGVVRVSLSHEPRAIGPGGRAQVALRLDIQPGWHINAHQPSSDALIPTAVTFEPHPFLDVGAVSYPAPARHHLALLNETLDVYHGTVVFTADAAVSAEETSPGQTLKLSGFLMLQACSDDVCLRPSTIPLALPMHLGAAAALSAPEEAMPHAASEGMPWGWWTDLMGHRSWGVWLLAAFLGGLALNLTPCVYPMIPVTVAFFSSQAAGRLGAALTLSAAYVVGMSVTYAALGLLASQTGALFGAWLQHPLVLVAMAVVLVGLALSLFGLYELQPPRWLAQRFGAAKAGHAGAFLMGLVVGFIATPCIGPFVVGLLLFVARLGDPWLGFWLFFTMGLGMGLPFVLIGTASNRAAVLPKAGAWLRWTKRGLGVVLCAMALYLLRPLVPAAAWRGPSASSSLVAWQPYSHARLAQAAREGRPALVDIYADWCIPCVELDHVTFRHPQVVERLNGSFTTLRVDATGAIPREGEELIERSGVYGVPSVLLFDAQGLERGDLRIAGFVTPEELLAILDQVTRSGVSSKPLD